MSKARVRTLAALASVLALMFAMAPTAGDDVPGPPSAGGVVPVLVEGNPSCSGLGYANGLKVDPPNSGTYYFDAVDYVMVSADGVYFAWSSTRGIDAVIVKGGSNANLFVYDPPAEAFGDGGLHSPINPTNQQPYGLSHFEFCYDLGLTASKTAEASWVRTYTWTIEKSVDPASHSGGPGDSFSSDYAVAVNRTVEDSDFLVSGTITVRNQSNVTAAFSVSDSVGGTPALVECPTYSLAPGASTVCTYGAGLASATDGTNTATVTSLTPGVEGAVATAGYAFGAPTVVGFPTINVTDSVQGPLGSAPGDYTFEYEDEFLCPEETSNYVDGLYSYDVPNTATIDETGQSDDANVHVDCYYEPPARLTIVKDAQPDDAAAEFSFSRDFGAGFVLVDPTHPSEVFGDLAAGTYTVSETGLPGGWQFDSVTCVEDQATSGGDVNEATAAGVATVTLEPGDAVTCTFVNVKTPAAPARLTIVKNAVPDDATVVFGFMPSANLPGGATAFLLPDAGSKVFDDLEAGTYSVAETSQAPGWQFSSVSCTGATGAAAPDYTVVGASVSVNLRPGEAVACTFVNIPAPVPPPGRIIVRKVTLPGDAPAQAFTFDPSWRGSFSLGGGGSLDSGPLAAGIYAVSERMPLPAGWSPLSATCSDGSSPGAIGLSPEETVTCTFVNRYEQREGPRGSLTIVKVATVLNPDDASALFSFGGTLGGFELADGESEVFTELEAGTYVVSESQPPPPSADPDDFTWQFDAVECVASDWSAAGPAATVNLVEGEAAVCTFYNYQEEVRGPSGSLTIVKETLPEGGTGFAFDAGALGTFTLDDGGSVVFNELEPSAYTVAEEAADGWAFAGVDCIASDWEASGAAVTVNLADGEAAVCTFTNGQLPYTGVQPFMLPMLFGGLWAVLMGLVLVVWPSVRRAARG